MGSVKQFYSSLIYLKVHLLGRTGDISKNFNWHDLHQYHGKIDNARFSHETLSSGL
jgi:hypothetical protein